MNRKQLIKKIKHTLFVYFYFWVRAEITEVFGEIKMLFWKNDSVMNNVAQVPD